jgi:DNA-binding LacI/PurR family transcriptional regulator
MSIPLRRHSLVEQTVFHLREGFRAGRWSGKLPGVLRLADELVVSKKIVREALVLLEDEGWIKSAGAGCARRVTGGPGGPGDPGGRRLLRVAVLFHDSMENLLSHTTRLMFGARRKIEAAGHVCVFESTSIVSMGSHPSRLAKLLEAEQADAWIVVGAPKDVLEWFVARQVPVLAFGGRFQDLPVACCATSIGAGIRSAMDLLRHYGHRRVSLMVTDILKQPKPVPSVDLFHSILREWGVTPSEYHLPSYEETTEGIQQCMGKLFQVTPPTALLVLDPSHCASALAFLTMRGLRVPRDVSLVCMMPDPVLRMWSPPLAHFEWPLQKHINRITRWVDGVVKGQVDQRQRILDVTFVPGGSIGPARR